MRRSRGRSSWQRPALLTQAEIVARFTPADQAMLDREYGPLWRERRNFDPDRGLALVKARLAQEAKYETWNRQQRKEKANRDRRDLYGD